MMVSSGSDILLPPSDTITNNNNNNDDDSGQQFLHHVINNSTTTSPEVLYSTDMHPDQLLIIYIFPAILVAGTVGNLASAIVLYRSRLRLTSVYFYLLVLSVADTTVLYSSGAKTWVRLVSGTEWLHVSDASCRLLTFITMFSMHFSAWLVVLTTADRFIAVWFPLKAAVLCSQVRARVAVLILLISTVLFDLHLFFTMKLQPESADSVNSLFCGPTTAAAVFMYQSFEYIKFASYCLIPFVTIFSLNVSIVFRLRWTAPALRNNRQLVTSYRGRPHGLQRLALVDRATSSGEDSSGINHGGINNVCTVRSVCGGDTSDVATTRRSTGASQTRVTSMLLVVSFTWLALTTPFAAVGFIYSVADISEETAERLMPFKAVSFLLMYANHAINFYLYCLTGRKFRHELLDALHALKRSLSCSYMSLRPRTSSNLGTVGGTGVILVRFS